MDVRVSELQQSLYRAAKADRSRRFHSLYDKLSREDILMEAWNRVRANKGAAGTDGRTIEDIEREGVDVFLALVARELREGTYRPSPLRRVWIPKTNGKVRGLGIPTVRDRVVQTAAKLVLEPVFEPDFEPNSYGFRPEKSAHDAVMEVVKWLNFGCERVIDADITACFDTIPKSLLMKEVARRVVDGSMLHLIRQWLDAGILEGGVVTSNPEQGTPQGSPISPLLANVFLDRLDKGWKQSGMEWKADAHLVRYADDFVILGRGEMMEEEAMKSLNQIIADIGLALSSEKTRLVDAEDGFDFLGFHFVRHYSKRRRKRVTRWFPSGKSRRRIMERIRQLTDKSNLSVGTPYDAREAVITSLRGWGEYFRRSMAGEVFVGVWEYADVSLGRMKRRWHQGKGIGRYKGIVSAGLSVLHTRIAPVPYGAYNAAR